MGPKLRKELGLLDVFCIASGAMISSGLFILPGIASARIGPSLFVSYIIASFLALPALLSKAELATAMPKAGGDYFFITRTMGLSVGTIGGFASWFSLSLKSAFALVGMGAYVALIVHVPISVVAILLCILFVAINIKGAKEAGIFQRYLVAGLFAALIFYIIKGFVVVDVNRFAPFIPYGKMSVFATAGFVFISYGGLTKIASLA
ncbi:MAG: amino acid permease, partial [Kiritimatiellia bacterium]|nr:amino acid permease [Kiritimatiellia bacterium]